MHVASKVRNIVSKFWHASNYSLRFRRTDGQNQRLHYPVYVLPLAYKPYAITLFMKIILYFCHSWLVICLKLVYFLKPETRLYGIGPKNFTSLRPTLNEYTINPPLFGSEK